MNASINPSCIPRFNPVYQVYFLVEAESVFFVDEYPLPFLFIGGMDTYDVLSQINNQRRVSDIARNVKNLSLQQIIHTLEQLHEKELVLFQ